MGFLYFISSEERPPTPEKIRQWGLSYAFTRSPEHRVINANSPNGKSGSVIADPDRMPGKVAGYHKDEQVWRKMPTVEGRPELWVGYWKDSPPHPSDLERKKMLRGMSPTLADGNEWWIPVVRKFDEELSEWKSELPSAWDCDDSGNLCRGTTPKREYAHLWDLTAPLADAMFASEADENAAGWPEEKEIAKAVRELLKTNYVIDAPEIAALELIGDSEAALVVMVATRYDALNDWLTQKKTDSSLTPPGSTSPAGKAA